MREEKEEFFEENYVYRAPFGYTAGKFMSSFLLRGRTIGVLGLGLSLAAVSKSGSIASSHAAPPSSGGDSMLLDHKIDHYNGVNITKVDYSEDKFASKLNASMERWRNDGRRGIWMRLKSPSEMHLLHTAVKSGFKTHSATEKEILLNYWLPEEESSLPGAPSYYLGVGVICINKEGKILAVQEKNGWLKGRGWWKMVTGLADPMEPIPQAALRELKEETGISGKFERVLAIRQGRGTLGKGDIFVVCLVEPLDEKLTPQESEIEKAEWMDIDAFFGQKWLSTRPAYDALNKAIYEAIRSDSKKGLVSASFDKDRMTIFIPEGAQSKEV